MRLASGPDDSDTSAVTLFLTRSEAKELRDALDEMVTQEPADSDWHSHVPSADCQTEITVAWADDSPLP